MLARGDAATRITAVSADSRRTAPGTLFVALPGARTSGVEFLRDACARGASAVAGAGGTDLDALPIAAAIPVVRCASPQRFVALAAHQLAGRPSDHLAVVGITGTSGKTTTSYLLESMFRAAGHAPGVVGTIEYRFPGHHEDAPLTTPDAVALQELLARMRTAHVSHVAMEVSSHALAQDRATGVAFDVGVFTNCSRDHLDYHGDMEGLLRGQGAAVPRAAAGVRQAAARRC